MYFKLYITLLYITIYYKSSIVIYEKIYIILKYKIQYIAVC